MKVSKYLVKLDLCIRLPKRVVGCGVEMNVFRKVEEKYKKKIFGKLFPLSLTIMKNRFTSVNSICTSI